MDTKSLLENYLGKKTRTTEKDMGNGSKQVCDLDSGDCYTIRMKDGLIERTLIEKKLVLEDGRELLREESPISHSTKTFLR